MQLSKCGSLYAVIRSLNLVSSAASQIVSSTQEKFSEFFNQRGHFNLSLNSLISSNLIYQIKFPITIANLCGHFFISG